MSLRITPFTLKHDQKKCRDQENSPQQQGVRRVSVKRDSMYESLNTERPCCNERFSKSLAKLATRSKIVIVTDLGTMDHLLLRGSRLRPSVN